MTTKATTRVSADIEAEFARRAKKMCEADPPLTPAKAYVRCIEADPQLYGLLDRARTLENYLAQS